MRKLIIIVVMHLCCFPVAVDAQKIFIEENSRVIVEMESVATNSWQTGTTSINDKVIQYIYGLNEYLSAPGNFKLTYKIKITNTGTYRFVWHSKVGNGTSSTEHNDTWLRIPDASAFFAYKNGVTLRPKGLCTNDCPEGSGKDGWFKAYSHGSPASSWTWNTATNDKNAYPIYARFDKPGIYTVEVSMRSNYHFLNRFVLFNEAVNTLSQSTSLDLPESGSELINSLKNNNEQKSVFRKSNDTNELKSDVYTNWSLWHINGTVQGSGFGNQINISSLNAGIYILHTDYGVQKIVI